MTSAGWHRVTVQDADQRIGDCAVCGAGVPLRRRVRRGAVEWSCMIRHRAYAGSDGRAGARSYRRLIGDRCERCGFLPVHVAQLDAHHRDGDHKNDTPENIATLCANCHRLEHVVVPIPRALNPASTPPPPVGGDRLKYGLEFNAWVAEHFPGVEPKFVESCAAILRGRRRVPSVESLRPVIENGGIVPSSPRKAA